MRLTKVLSSDLVEPEKKPCSPSPCGPYSECRQVNSHAVCSCQKGYVGSPPACKPECMVSSECAQNKACVHQKCVDPCPGTCGLNARCQVVSHNPICSCPPGHSGDPFIRCLPERKHKIGAIFTRNGDRRDEYRTSLFSPNTITVNVYNINNILLVCSVW